MKKTILMFSGPAGSGKTTCCEYFEEKYGANHLTFKDGMYPFAYTFLSGLGYEGDYDDFLLKCKHTELKDRPIYKEWTPRSVMMHVSEKVVKPAFGKDFFGRQTATKIKSSANPLQVLDVGFIEEYNAVYDKLKEEATFIVIDVHREGYEFNDDRQYLGELLNPQADNQILGAVYNEGGEDLYKDLDTLYDLIIRPID